MPTFREDIHLGHKVAMTDTDDLVNGSVTKEKLSDDLWKEICRMASDELLVAVFGVTTYETALYYYENEKIIIGKSADLYFNMVRFNDEKFVFTQVDERGTLHTMVLSVDGWSDSVAQMELATGDIDMEIGDIDEMINN